MLKVRLQDQARTSIYTGRTSLRQRLHETGSVWNRYEIGTDKPCVYTGTDGSGTDWICCVVPNGSTYEGDPVWNRTIPVSNRSRVNRVDPYHSGSDPKRIWTYPISCKRSLKLVVHILLVIKGVFSKYLEPLLTIR